MFMDARLVLQSTDGFSILILVFLIFCCLNTGDYIDFYLQRYSGSDGADVLVSNMTIIIK